MTRRRKKQIGKELGAIASLRDSDIDTSDIPEITDWSQAVVGKFYRSARIDTSHPASSDAAFTPRPLPIPNFGAQPSTGVAVAEMAHRQLVLECAQGGAEAWTEFVRRFNNLIAAVVVRAARKWGGTSRDVIEDLVQDVYVKLAADNFDLLRKFEALHDDAFWGYLKVITANVVYGHFRALASHKKGGAPDSIFFELASDILTESGDSGATAENAVFMEEIDRVLKASASDRDRAIFWLYYRDGLSAKAIASIPTFGLTIKGTESAILRLTKALRRDLAQEPSAHQSQMGGLALPLADQILRARSPKKKE